MTFKLTEEQQKRFKESATDELEQPLTCYGCIYAASPSKENEATHFPGLAVEWKCLHCARNKGRDEWWSKFTEEQRKDSRDRYGIWEDGLDLYVTSDTMNYYKWWKL
jgi:hypothetical protein